MTTLQRPSETVRNGLSSLLNAMGEIAVRCQRIRTTLSAPMPHHPFGCEIDTGIGDIHPSLRPPALRIFLVADPGHTDVSVDRLLVVAAYGMQANASDSASFRYLRIIVCNDDAVYFEIGTTFGVFICGGCGVHTGTGGQGARVLRELFTAISQIYDVPVQEMRISGTYVRDGIDTMRRAYDRMTEQAMA